MLIPILNVACRVADKIYMQHLAHSKYSVSGSNYYSMQNIHSLCPWESKDRRVSPPGGATRATTVLPITDHFPKTLLLSYLLIQSLGLWPLWHERLDKSSGNVTVSAGHRQLDDSETFQHQLLTHRRKVEAGSFPGTRIRAGMCIILSHPSSGKLPIAVRSTTLRLRKEERPEHTRSEIEKWMLPEELTKHTQLARSQPDLTVTKQFSFDAL